MNDILELTFYSTDLDRTVTIRQFFFELMKKLWLEQDEFSGKRPFGNSDWDADLILCLINNKLVKGKVDVDGFIQDYDDQEVKQFVLDKILSPFFK